MTALLISGDAKCVEFLRRMLCPRRSPKLRLERLEDLSAGLARLPVDDLDLVLLDLAPNESSQPETFLTIYRSNPCMPVILLASPHQEKLALKAVAEGAQDYLVKDQFDAHQLFRAIQCAVARNQTQRALSLTDDLTGFRNQRGFFILGEHQLRLADRNGGMFSILFADLDGLKKINDAHGHAAGDEALLAAAQVIKETLRGSDILARLGGDEFVALLPNTAGKALENLRHRLQMKLQARNHDPNRRYQLSLSIGVATYDAREPCSLSALLARADASMYEGKHSRERTGWTDQIRVATASDSLPQPRGPDSTVPSPP